MPATRTTGSGSPDEAKKANERLSTSTSVFTLRAQLNTKKCGSGRLGQTEICGDSYFQTDFQIDARDCRDNDSNCHLDAAN